MTPASKILMDMLHGDVGPAPIGTRNNSRAPRRDLAVPCRRGLQRFGRTWSHEGVRPRARPDRAGACRRPRLHVGRVRGSGLRLVTRLSQRLRSRARQADRQRRDHVRESADGRAFDRFELMPLVRVTLAPRVYVEGAGGIAFWGGTHSGDFVALPDATAVLSAGAGYNVLRSDHWLLDLRAVYTLDAEILIGTQKQAVSGFILGPALRFYSN